MRLVFFGTPSAAVAALDALLASHHDVAAVVTQPDRPRGRSGTTQPSPVKARAEAAGLPVLQPSSPREEGFAEPLRAFSSDVCAVVAYGHILPPEVLAVPPRGFVNVHFSLLPRYRGAAPVQRAIMAGESETGVSIFLLEPTLDTGPVIAQEREPISPDDTTGTLLERLAVTGARLLVSTLDAIEAGSVSAIEQDDTLATLAPKVKPVEGDIDWTRSAAEIANLVRALNPAPGAYSGFRGKRLKIWRAAPTSDAGTPGDASPGSLVVLERDRPAVTTGDGVLELLDVQLEGAKRLEATTFARGQRLIPGEGLSST